MPVQTESPKVTFDKPLTQEDDSPKVKFALIDPVNQRKLDLFEADEETEEKEVPQIKTKAKLWNDDDEEDELPITKK